MNGFGRPGCRAPRRVAATLAVALALAVLGGSSAGCATSASDRDADRAPPIRARTAAANTVTRAVSRGVGRTENRDRYRVEIRYNPPRCPGPPFEVRARGRWNRAWLDASSSARSPMGELREKRKDQSGAERRQTVEVSGRFTGSRRAETGATYPVFWVERFEPGA